MAGTTPDFASLGFTELNVTFDAGVVVLTINREKQRNTFGGAFVSELIQAFDLCDRDDRVRVVILTARPEAPAYCSGADLSGGWNLLSPNEINEGPGSHRDTGGKVAMAIYRCRKITIAAVNGHAAGIGLTGLQLPFDIRFVWAGAKLAFPFVRRGITPEATSTYLLPRLLGHSRASSLLLTGDTVSPESPLIRDMYHQILPTREAVLPAALSLAKDLAVNTTPVAVAFTKGLLQHPGDSIEENHLYDSRTLELMAKSKDAVEGAMAFIERRTPRFTDTLSENPGSGLYPWWKPLDTTHRRAKL